MPNVGAPDCIDMVEAKLPIRQGAPGLMSCTSARQAVASASTCASVPATVVGLMAPCQHPGCAGDRLAGAGIGLERTGHVGIEHQRRVGVGHAIEHGVLGHVVRTEEDARHVDGMAGPFCTDEGPHEGPVRPADVRIEHVEVALVGGQVNRFAHNAARMMQPRNGVMQLHQRDEILVAGIAAARSRSCTKGGPHDGHSTVPLPPSFTVLAGLRACCRNACGAVA